MRIAPGLFMQALLILTLQFLPGAPAQASASANAACSEDGCQACMSTGSCMLSMLSECRDPFCIAFGVGGGLLGTVGGGIVGPMVLTLPAMAAYPGVDPQVAFLSSILVGAGVGCVLGGLPGMACGSMIGGGGWFAGGGRSCVPWTAPGRKRVFRPRRKHKKRR